MAKPPMAEPEAPPPAYDVANPYVMSSGIVTSGDSGMPIGMTTSSQLVAYYKSKNKRGEKLYFLKRDGEPGWFSTELPADAVLMTESGFNRRHCGWCCLCCCCMGIVVLTITVGLIYAVKYSQINYI